MDKDDMHTGRIIFGILSLFLTIWMVAYGLYAPISYELVGHNVMGTAKQCEITLDKYETLFTDEIIGLEAMEQKQMSIEYNSKLKDCRVYVSTVDLQLQKAYLIWWISIVLFAGGMIVAWYMFLAFRKSLKKEKVTEKGTYRKQLKFYWW